MKKLLLVLAIVLAPGLAWGQCTGVFPSKTICGNLGASAAPPSAWSSSGTIVGPVISTLNGLPKWGDAIGQSLVDAAGTTIAGGYTWSGAQTFSGNNTFQTGITNFTGTFEVGGKTFTWPAAGTTVGGLGTAQTWTGNNTFNTGVVNLAGTTQLNGGAIGTVLTDNSVFNNCSLAGSVAGSALTVALKDASGADPSASSPCTVGFRSSTATTGSYSLVQTATPTAITAPSGASLGSTNGVPFRVWTVLFNNGGTAALGLIQTVTGGATPTAISAIQESSTPSPTAISAGSTSAGTFYAASSIGNKAFRILGYLDFSTGQATAGTWVTAPDRIQSFGPGIKKPGDTVQTVYVTTTSTSTVANATPVATALNGSITPTSSINFVKVDAVGRAACGTSCATLITAQIYRTSGSVALGNTATGGTATASSRINAMLSMTVLDRPQSASAVQYGVYIINPNGADTWTFLSTVDSVGTNSGIMTMTEIMD